MGMGVVREGDSSILNSPPPQTPQFVGLFTLLFLLVGVTAAVLWILVVYNFVCSLYAVFQYDRKLHKNL